MEAAASTALATTAKAKPPEPPAPVEKKKEKKREKEKDRKRRKESRRSRKRSKDRKRRHRSRSRSRGRRRDRSRTRPAARLVSAARPKLPSGTRPRSPEKGPTAEQRAALLRLRLAGSGSRGGGTPKPSPPRAASVASHHTPTRRAPCAQCGRMVSQTAQAMQQHRFSVFHLTAVEKTAHPDRSDSQNRAAAEQRSAAAWSQYYEEPSTAGTPATRRGTARRGRKGKKKSSPSPDPAHVPLGGGKGPGPGPPGPPPPEQGGHMQLLQSMFSMVLQDLHQKS